MNISASPILLPTPKPRKKPDTAVSLIQLSTNLKECNQIHSLLIKTSLIKEKHAFGRFLLSLTSSKFPDSLTYARNLFDTIDIPRNSFMYNTMIKAYTNSGNPREAFLIFSKIGFEEDCVCFDDFTFTFVFAACSKFGGVLEGKQAHAQMVKCGLKFGTHSWNSLMGFYVKIGEVGSGVKRLFDRIESPDIVSWNCLIDGFVKSGDLAMARKVFDEMPARDVVSWTSMLVGYVNAGLLDDGCYLFDQMPERNLVSWTALINGYMQTGCYSKAFRLAKEMQIAKVEMDVITVTTLMSACAKLGAIDQGRWLHGYVDKHGIEIDAHLSTALIDMYGKCGRIDLAWNIFEETADKKVFVWNAMLGALAIHSFGEEAVRLFMKMEECGIAPNEITYLNILAACNHSGLVDIGMRISSRIQEDKQVQPTLEHYGCLVDLLSRAGFLYEAFNVIQMMPFKADGDVWRALLGACKLHRNVELAEEVGTMLFEMEPLNYTNYVLLSNVYASASRWEAAAKLRKAMKTLGLTKMPGCSLVEVNGIVHEFVSRDYSHPCIREIHELLQSMANHMMQDGYS